jgi:transcriptional regulator with XRE-family HTH domain
MIELRKYATECRSFSVSEKATTGELRYSRVAAGLGVVEESRHVRKQCVREPGDLQGVCASTPVREGERTITHDTNVHKLGAKLGIDPAELLRAFNGRAPPSKAVVAGLAKALDVGMLFLDRLAKEIRKDLAAK